MFQPDRLALARRRRGLNFTRLAKLARMTPQTVSAYERGLREPPNDAVQSLATTLDFPVEFFYSELGDAVPEDAASFRSLSTMTASQHDRALAAGTLCVLLHSWFDERFNLPAVDIPDLTDGQADPAGAAAHVRATWGLGEHPIANLTQLVEAHGVRVFSLADDCHAVDAFSFWHNGAPFALIGTHKTPERGVFDLAHELGHLVLHRDHRAPRGRAAETQANEFASALLMPEADIRGNAPRFPAMGDLIRAKRRWRVSAAALNYRLHALGLIDHWHYQSLCVEISRIGRDREVDSIPQERSEVTAKILGMLRQNGVSLRAIATDLHVRPSEINDLMFGLAMVSVDGGREASGDRTERPALRLVATDR
ncbi:MAG: XRE family transcriptional regulator [Ilumatobacteraceae bacterium]